MAGIAWTIEEVSQLQQLWNSDLTLEELASQFSGRTPISIQVKAKRLKLRHTKDQFHRILSKKTTGTKNGMYGRQGPRRGVTLSPELRAKLSVVAKEGYASGRRVPMNGADNPAFGKPSPMRGKSLPDSAKETLSRKASQRWAARTQKSKDDHLLKMRAGWITWANKKGPTKIEILVQGWLESLGVEFTSQTVVSFFIVDFLVQGNKVIETHGDYWHGNPTKYSTFDRTQRANQRRDRAKWTLLQKRGFKLLALWEDDLWERPENCRKQIQEFLA